MKKEYIKPAVCIQKLELAQQIASCGEGTRGSDNPFGYVNSGSKSSCGFFMNQFGTTVFVKGNGNCNEIVKDNGKSTNGVCYNTISPRHTIFVS